MQQFVSTTAQHPQRQMYGSGTISEFKEKTEIMNIDHDVPKRDYSQIKLKENHAQCPLWIAPDYRIFLEAFSPLYREATDFLIAIAEPVSRPTYIHEYILTPYSLYSAASVGLTKNEIFLVLQRLAKNEDIPEDINSYIEKYS